MTSPYSNSLTNYILYNLLPGQCQFGNRVFGRGTTVRIESFDIKPTDINNQDYQVNGADEIRFGQDSFKPTTIELTFDILYNKLRPDYEDLIPNFWAEMPKVEDFAYLWRNDAYRNIPGSMIPLYVCGKDGVTRAVYGRPRQFNYNKPEEYDEFIQCVGEFQRADSLAYSAEEDFVELQFGSEPVFLVREKGDGPDTWMRLLLSGPLTNPVVTIGDQQMKLDYDIAEGEYVEISSYPWQRRAVNSDGLNLSANLVGQQYLDRFVIPYGQEVPLKWTSDEATTMVPDLGNKEFIQNIDGYSWLQLPGTYTTIHGRVSVKFDLFDFGLLQFPFLTPRKYLAASFLQQVCACYYNAAAFNTADQLASAKLVAPGIGKSVLTIMTNDDMSQLVGVMVDSNLPTLNYLHIVSGSWAGLTVRATWQNPNFFGFAETDTVGIKSEQDEQTGIVTYTALFNGTPVASWQDTNKVISSDTTNRRQGFVFDADGNLLFQGTGFCNIIAYDTKAELAQHGQCFLLWRDSWSTVG